MTPIEIGFISLIAMLLLIWAGMHVGVALTLLSLLGVWAIKDDFGIASSLLALATYDAIANHVFGVVPLFVLMGLLVSTSDIGRETFGIAHQIFGRLRGGLGIATVAANAVFAAITGISIASAAVFTKVAIPEMLRLGYTPRFSVGVVAGSSVLGMLIPPSLLLIIYGLISQQSIGALFLAGVIPGIILAVTFGILILVLSRFTPTFVRMSDAEEQPQIGMLDALRILFPILLLIIIVLGGIYGGVFTPTEAGAIGALGALVIAISKRSLTFSKLWKVLVETGHVTVSISFLIIAASLYTRMLTLSGIPQWLLGGLQSAELGFVGVLCLYLLVLIILGTVLDSTSILLVTVPLALPVFAGFGSDLVWFGIVTVIAVEIGLLTPPLGLAVYVIHGALDDSRIKLWDIFIGAMPFAFAMLCVLILVSIFPSISLYLTGR